MDEELWDKRLSDEGLWDKGLWDKGLWDECPAHLGTDLPMLAGLLAWQQSGDGLVQDHQCPVRWDGQSGPQRAHGPEGIYIHEGARPRRVAALS